MELLVQKFLKNHSLKELQELHGVYASFSKSGHKASFNYDQIEAKENDPLAQECRGLILSAIDGHSFLPQAVLINNKLNYDHIVIGETKIISFPMRRFFNYGQGSAADINWSDPKLAILEKLDGTLCIISYDPFTCKWCVSTRSVSEADLLMDNGIFTFRTLFEKAVKDTTGLSFDQFTEYLHSDFTYCFELTTPYNRIVVDYKECGITLLAVRDLNDLAEVYPDACDIVEEGIVPCVQTYTYTNIPELLDWVSSLSPLEHEGVVVRDANFNRIKVKNAQYIVYNKLHDRLGSSQRNLMEFILLETDDDIIFALAPEIGQKMIQLKEGLQKSIHEHDLVYDIAKSYIDVAHPGSKKEFALAIQKAVQHGKTINRVIWSAPLFQMFDGKIASMKDFILKNKKDGTWADSFLDRILEISNHY